jgi:hypothetical protein
MIKFDARRNMHMKHLGMTLLLAVLALALLASSGCQPTLKRTSVSDPPSLSITKPDYTLGFEPLKRGRPAFEVFRFTLSNRGREAIRIDWHKTVYMLNGRSYGMFVSKETEPGRVKDPDKRYDTVAPGATFTRDIAPVKLIAYAPAKYSMNASEDSATFTAGPIPPGRSGIRLRLIQGEKNLLEDLTVKIVEKELE